MLSNSKRKVQRFTLTVYVLHLTGNVSKSVDFQLFLMRDEVSRGSN